jgi:hypothetical protein
MVHLVKIQKLILIATVGSKFSSVVKVWELSLPEIRRVHARGT